MSDREPLAGADNAWRRMGTAHNLMTITGVMSFDGTVTYDELCDRLEARLLRFDRFKQRVEGRKRRIRQPYWTEMSDMDVRTHVYELSLPEPKNKAAFERFIGNLVSRPLDERRPLWEAYLVEDAGAGDGNAVVFRLNHSIGDGFALLSVLLGLVDNPGEINLPMGGVPTPPSPDDKASGDTDTGDRTVETIQGDRQPRPASGESVEEHGGGAFGTVRSALEGVGTAAQAVKSGYNLLAMGDDPQTSLHGQIGTVKRVAWTDELDVQQIKRIGRAHDTTINDVLLGATAGGLRRVFEQRGEDTGGLTVRCTMPVNIKGMEGRDSSLGNHFGLAFIPIPVGTRDLDERIRLVREQTGRQKIGIEAYLMYLLLKVGGHVPERVQAEVMKLFERRSMGVFTNVPGPTDTLEFCGEAVADIMFWVPQSIDQGMGISIFSYDGSVRIGVNSDKKLLPNPRLLTEALETEVATLAENVEKRS